jgi:hypothetical protein
MIATKNTTPLTVSTAPEDGIVPAPAATSDVDGAARLLRLATLGEELGTNRVADEARELAARISEGRFYLACIGQFKRGKSTLINALIGAPVLPVGFVPVTAVPTVIRFGERQRARVRARDCSWREIPVPELGEYVSEEHNPENSKGVVGVEVFVPSPLLASGMCLVDTPGLGSVFTGNAAATEAFIPHIDAALVVVGADPPLAGEELALVEVVARHVEDLILVINKADRTTDEERAAAAGFTRKLLEKRLQRPAGPVFEVSAAERLENRGPERDWGRLVEALGQLVEDSGRQLIRAACERGLERLGEQLLAIISEEREALERPIEESERLIRAMKESVAGAERSMRELGYLFMAEQHHLSDTLVGRHKAFLVSLSPQASREFEQALKSTPRGMGPSYRRRVMREAQDVARRHVLPWLQTEQAEAEKEYRAHATCPRPGSRISDSIAVHVSRPAPDRATGIAAAVGGRFDSRPRWSLWRDRKRCAAISYTPAGNQLHSGTKRHPQPGSGKPQPPGGRDPQAPARNQTHR